MIVTPVSEGDVLVRQVDHQDQCALMAGAWGNASFARIGAHRSLEVAAACHDEGWRAWEETPRVNGAGRPVDFPDVDRAEHVALYTAAIDAAAGRDVRAGLLVSMHGTGLYRARLGLDSPVRAGAPKPDVVEHFLAQEDARQARLRARIGGGPVLERWAWAAYRLLQAWDLLSLALLWGRLAGREITLRRVPRHEDDGAGVDLVVRPTGRWQATVSPWPFAVAELELPVRARVIPSVSYADDAALGAALARAPWADLAAGVRRAG